MEPVLDISSSNIVENMLVHNKKFIALTFDDGPNNTTTLEVLSVLNEYNVKATFFVIGNNITEDTKGVLKKIYDNRCEIGNHSNSHGNLTELNEEDIIKEIEVTSSKIEEVIGTYPKVFRAPYLAINDMVYNLLQMPVIGGHGARDWESEVSAKERAEMVLSETSEGSIILLHDFTGNDQTVEALHIILPNLQQQGYEFVTVSELLQVYQVPYKKRQHYTYTNVCKL